MTEMQSFPLSAFGAEYWELFLTPVFQDVDFKQVFRFVPTKLSELKLDFVNELTGIIQSGENCGFDAKGQVTISRRCVKTKDVKINLKTCFKQFRNTIYAELYARGIDRPDTRETLLNEILLIRARQGLKKDLQALAFFGDVNSVNQSLNLADGMWTKHIPAMTANPLSGIKSFDAGAGAYAPGQGTTAIRNLYYNSSEELKGLPANQRVMLVSVPLYEAFIRDREDGTIGTTAYIGQLSRGEQTILTYHGVPIIPMYFWQQYANLFPVPPAPGAPLRAGIHTTVDNMIFAGDIENGEFRQWYEEKDEEVLTKSRFTVGFDYVHESLFCVTYTGAPAI